MKTVLNWRGCPMMKRRTFLKGLAAALFAPVVAQLPGVVADEWDVPKSVCIHDRRFGKGLCPLCVAEALRGLMPAYTEQLVMIHPVFDRIIRDASIGRPKSPYIEFEEES